MHNPFDPGYYDSTALRTFGFASVGENVLVAKTCKIVGVENIHIGDHSRIDDFTTLIAVGGSLTIGRYVHIHSYCQIGARGGVIFEDFVNMASQCLVFSASDDGLGRQLSGSVVPRHLTKPKIAAVRFARHSIAYARCTILPGVTFGEGAIACAHSLVARDLPEWWISAGSPAVRRIARPRDVLALTATIDEADGVAA